MSIKGQLPKFSDIRPKLTVIGVGGAGCNAVNNMIASGLDGVEFIVANTDAQALAASAAEVRIQLGATLTEGLGAGSRPEIGEAAAEEAIEDIRAQIAGSHMVFIAAGMGGGTGTGAASVIARVARELGILTVGVITKPFLFEGARRMRVAEVGVAELRNFVDTLIVIPNQNLFRIASEKTTFSEAFVMADQVLYSGVACIVDLIIKEGLINLDFADVRTIMSGMGSAMMGTGEASGDRRATLAAEEAISNPLIDDVSLKGAKGLLLSITGGSNLTLYEVDEAAGRVRQEVDPEANIIVGATYDPNLGDRVRVSIVASGMARPGEAERAPPAPVENWGGRAAQGGAPAAAQPAANQSAPNQAADAKGQQPAKGAAPPQQPPAEPARQSEDMQRRLTAALQYAPVAQAQQPAAPVGSVHARELWRAPGNVMIEEAAPQLPATHLPPPIPNSADPRVQAAQGFTPAAPSEIRRDARRMPDVGDFPQVGQRVYRAMEAGTPPRRPGLFERLAGAVRGESDSRSRAQGGRAPYPQQEHLPQQSRADAPEHPSGEQPLDARMDSDQRLDMPMFFNRRR